ncbi:MAG TPA: DedA family protein [Mesorhizobium sp.]|jgi:membrane protein DedA with SNARE-associated domain|nr:DedA family protein [Mesorhizobium sp.]
MFDWLTGIVETTGYVGIALLMLAENVFPPIPSELIMPLAGFTAAQGELNIVLVLLSGTLGSMAGAVLWYWIGLRFGLPRLKRLAARHGRWLTLSPEDVDKASDWFERYGALAVLIGRLAPVVRTLISVPAGMAKMPLPKFLIFSTIGTIVWNAILLGAGFMLRENYELVADYVDPLSTSVIVGVVGLYLYRVVTWRPREKVE